MADKQTRAATTDPGPAPVASGAPETTAQSYGNAAANQDLSSGGGGGLAGQVPSTVNLQELGVNFQIPGGTTLVGGWNPLGTSGGTTVFVRMTEKELHISFSPPLFLDAVWPMSNVEWYGVSYDFTKGAVSRVDVRNTQTVAIGMEGTVDGHVRDFINAAVSGTPIGKAGYDPFKDPNPMASMAAVQAKIAAGGGSSTPPPLGAQDLTKITPMATISLKQDITQGTDAGGIHIAAGTPITIYAELGGTAQDLMSGGVQRVESISLSTPGIELTSKGAPIAKLQELEVLNGGEVRVSRFEGLGKLKDAQGVESGLKALGLLLQLAIAREGGNPGPLISNLNPDIVDGVATSELQKALTGALHDLIVQHHDAIPSVDLRTVLGVGP